MIESSADAAETPLCALSLEIVREFIIPRYRYRGTGYRVQGTGYRVPGYLVASICTRGSTLVQMNFNACTMYPTQSLKTRKGKSVTLVEFKMVHDFGFGHWFIQWCPGTRVPGTRVFHGKLSGNIVKRV
eukprot:3120112-Rhodomonas_salina.1